MGSGRSRWDPSSERARTCNRHPDTLAEMVSLLQLALLTAELGWCRRRMQERLGAKFAEVLASRWWGSWGHFVTIAPRPEPPKRPERAKRLDSGPSIALPTRSDCDRQPSEVVATAASLRLPMAYSARETEARLLSGPLHTWDQIRKDRSLRPEFPGIYGWYFNRNLPIVRRRGSHQRGRWRLLYVGISPSRASSRSTVYSRVQYHFRGNCSGSTLRTTLACLLEGKIHTRLRRSGSSLRLTHEGEARLREWMRVHARVSWVGHPRPWIVEPELIDALSLPLNIEHNRHHPFRNDLVKMRADAKARATKLPPLSR